MSQKSKEDNSNGEQKKLSKAVPGWVVIVGMFGFAFFMFGLLWGYWTLYTAPFHPLQEALVHEFPDSQPRVEGGAYKSHVNPEQTLRIVLRVAYDPNLETKSCTQDANRIAKLAAEKLPNISTYSTLVIKLFHRPLTGDLQMKIIDKPLDDFPLPLSQ